MADSTLTPELALRYLDELSTDIRAAALLGRSGELAAHRGVEGDDADVLHGLVTELFEGADAASSAEPPAQVEVWTPAGAVFAVRGESFTVAVVTGRFALPSLMFYDLRAMLSDLGDRAA